MISPEFETLMASREDNVQTISIVVPVYQGELNSGTSDRRNRTADHLPIHSRRRSIPCFRSHTGPRRRHRWLRCCHVVVGRQAAVRDPDLAVTQLRSTSSNAGRLASTNGDWVVSLDEDGQHDPRDISRLLDVAVKNDVQLVYAQPTNEPPHGWVRNCFSALAKWIFKNLLGHAQFRRIQ